MSFQVHSSSSCKALIDRWLQNVRKAKIRKRPLCSAVALLMPFYHTLLTCVLTKLIPRTVPLPSLAFLDNLVPYIPILFGGNFSAKAVDVPDFLTLRLFSLGMFS